jgi:hypothetical protein
MGWIEASLRFAGQFASGEKAAYMDRFGVGAGQASHDQGRFAQEVNKRCGAVLIEVARGKLNIVEGSKLPPEPVFEIPRMAEWLEVALGPSFFLRVESARRREPAILTLRSVIVAIRERKPLEIVYLSRSSGRSRKVISPHVIVDVADRLHLRGYDHARNRFSDFVLSRIEETRPATAAIPFIRPDRDEDWRRLVRIEIRAHAELVGERLQSVIRDFGLDEEGSRQVRRRAAVARYLVDQPTDAALGFASPVSVRILE